MAVVLLFPSVPYNTIDVPSFDNRTWFVHPVFYSPALAVNNWLESTSSFSFTRSADASPPQFCPYSDVPLATASYCVVKDRNGCDG